MSIIAIQGKMGSGKDLVGSIMKDKLSGHWEIKKFALKVKEVASLITGIPLEKFEDQGFKTTYLGTEWDYWTVSMINDGVVALQLGRFTNRDDAKAHAAKFKKSYGGFYTQYVVGMRQMTVRQLLQEIGTDAMRDSLHPSVWVNSLMSEYKCVPADRAPNGWDCDNWIITDLRFPNEYGAVKSKGGIVVKIERPGIQSTNHPSETSLDEGYPADYTIVNDGTIEDLHKKVGEILAETSFDLTC